MATGASAAAAAAARCFAHGCRIIACQVFPALNYSAVTRSDVLRGQCWDLNKADDSRSTRGGSVRGTFKRRKLDAATTK